jgi:hypothetical protein
MTVHDVETNIGKGFNCLLDSSKSKCLKLNVKQHDISTTQLIPTCLFPLFLRVGNGCSLTVTLLIVVTEINCVFLEVNRIVLQGARSSSSEPLINF